MNTDDPKLTAFALDELDEAEKSTIARTVAESPEAQRIVDETREIARALKNEFVADIANEKPVAVPVRRNLSDIRDDPWFWSRARPLAFAAAIAIFTVLSAIAIATYNLRRHSTSSATVDYAVIEGEEKPHTQILPEFATPNYVANPLHADAIKRIEHVVIGEIDRDPHLENAELRVIEVINDAYRIERLKQRLRIPVVSKKSYHGLGGQSYQLMFLDRTGHLVASAQFYRTPDLGFVLQPLKNAYETGGRYFVGGGAVLPGDWQTDVNYREYVIQFPDWGECIGYAPGA
jgi:hypothetical protein